MKFKVDENLPRDVAAALRQSGHEACTVGDQGLIGQPDEVVAEVSRGEQRVLVTMDKDFSDIRRYPPEDYAGLIVLRTDDPSKPTVLRMMQMVTERLGATSPAGNLWIVTEDQVRSRGR